MNVSRCVFACALIFAACEPNDLGRPCPPPDGTTDGVQDASPDDTEIVFPATVRKDGKCESFNCVSTQVRQNYCSQECANNGDCPDGFACETLQPVGPLSQTRYCLLQKVCRDGVASDCPRETMYCHRIETTIADQPAFFCDVDDRPK